MKRIFLAEDHAAFRKALAFMLEREPHYRVTAQAGSVAEARASDAAACDVAVVDLLLPDGDGTEVIRELRATNPDARILSLSVSQDPGRALDAGADEVLGKDASLSSVVATVRRLAEN
jgi:DNA-binding NarL/FixJ family response regulator